MRAALTSATAAVRLDALEALEAVAGRAAQPLLAHHAAQVLGLYVEVLAEVTRAQGAELHVHKTHVKVYERFLFACAVCLHARCVCIRAVLTMGCTCDQPACMCMMCNLH